MGDRPRLYAFDLEGTLALLDKEHYKYPSVWPALAEAIGPECFAEENRLTDLWNAQRAGNGQHFSSYVDYMERTIEIHQRHGLTSLVFNAVLDNVPWIEGIKQTFGMLQERNGIIAIVTGGFENHAERVPGRERVRFIRAACKYIFSDGRLARWELREYDWQGKVAALQEICKSRELKFPRDVRFVGDGKNDVEIVKAVPGSIAFNAHPELRQAATYHVEAPDLRYTMPYLLER